MSRFVSQNSCCSSVIRRMREILFFVLTVMICLGLSAPAWASETVPFCEPDPDLSVLTDKLPHFIAYYSSVYGRPVMHCFSGNEIGYSPDSSRKDLLGFPGSSYVYLWYGDEGWKISHGFSGSGFGGSFVCGTDKVYASNVDLYLDGKLFLANMGAGSDSSQYDPLVPAPQNVRFVGSDGDYGALIWDSQMVDDKYGVMITADYAYESELPIFGSSGYLTNMQILKTSDGYKANTSKWSQTKEWFDSLHELVLKKLNWAEKLSGLWIHPTRFDVQFYYTDDAGVVHYGDYSKCIINWKSSKDYSCTSSVYKGGVDPDDQTGSLPGGSGTHIDENGVVHGGGGVSLDGYNHFDSDGNMVESESAPSTIEGFLQTLVNLPNVLNKFFQSVSSIMSSMQSLPGMITTMFAFLPAEFQTLMLFGISCVIVLRIFGR